MKVQIPSPCQEKKENMTIAGNGKFCHSCNKEVIDFTEFTDQQLIDYLDAQPGIVCGSFLHSQLDKTLTPHVVPGSHFKVFPASLLSLAISFFIPQPAAASSLPKQNMYFNADQYAEKHTDTTEYSVLKGTVTDSSGEPISGAIVQLEKELAGSRVVTDSNGVFTLRVPVKTVADNFYLSVSMVGYTSQQIITQKDANDLVIILKTSDLITMGEIFMVRTRPRNLWHYPAYLWRKTKNWLR